VSIKTKAVTFFATLALLAQGSISSKPAEAGIIPSSAQDYYEMATKTKQWFSKGNWAWFLAEESTKCLYTNLTSGSGLCERNPNLVYVSQSEVFKDSTLPCTNDYQDRQANIYARKNGLKYLFYTPQNRVYTFEK
jgi:hypothetical protein